MLCSSRATAFCGTIYGSTDSGVVFGGALCIALVRSEGWLRVSAGD